MFAACYCKEMEERRLEEEYEKLSETKEAFVVVIRKMVECGTAQILVTTI